MKKIKVCGMRSPENILELANLLPELMGFIFYEKSSRYVGEDFEMPELPAEIKKVGVFVHASMEQVIEKAQKYRLDYLQLHSNESPEYCKALYEQGYKIIKAFAVDASFQFAEVEAYTPWVSYFLWDTKGEGYGGHGQTFPWLKVQEYPFSTPFFIAGGISNKNIDELLQVQHPQFVGIDVNSKYEISPALKDIEALNTLFLKVRNS